MDNRDTAGVVQAAIPDCGFIVMRAGLDRDHPPSRAKEFRRFRRDKSGSVLAALLYEKERHRDGDRIQ